MSLSVFLRLILGFDFGFWVLILGFGFWVLGFGFWVLRLVIKTFDFHPWVFKTVMDFTPPHGFALYQRKKYI